MTKQQALTELKRTRELNTNMLEPLGISFEAFLRLAQFSKEKRTQYIYGAMLTNSFVNLI